MEEPLSERIRRQRDATGLSLRRLGAALGVSFSSLARIERGVGLPDQHTLWLLIRWLDGPDVAGTCHCFRCVSGTPSLLQRVEHLEQRLSGIEESLDSLLALVRALQIPSLHELLSLKER